jgi:hypothetical protein
MAAVDYHREVLLLNDDQLERFVREWLDLGKQYHKCIRVPAPGDMGRDVVGFLAAAGYESGWDNYQCKQYGGSLPTNVAILELGKILYHAWKGNFPLPSKYYFVAPRNLNRNLETLIHKPTALKAKLFSDWNTVVANDLVEGVTVILEPALRAFIDGFDFSNVGRISLDEILGSPQSKLVLFKWFGADPGPAPAGVTPATVQERELPYIAALVDAYSERDALSYADHTALPNNGEHSQHFSEQRELFFHAEEFKRFYRDCTEETVLKNLETDLYHGIKPVVDSNHADKLQRVNAVLAQASKVQVTGPLSNHARTPIRQGVCHHFVNEGKIRWKK